MRDVDTAIGRPFIKSVFGKQQTGRRHAVARWVGHESIKGRRYTSVKDINVIDVATKHNIFFLALAKQGKENKENAFDRSANSTVTMP